MLERDANTSPPLEATKDMNLSFVPKFVASTPLSHHTLWGCPFSSNTPLKAPDIANFIGLLSNFVPSFSTTNYHFPLNWFASLIWCILSPICNK
jgi:hypothetical protein